MASRIAPEGVRRMSQAQVLPAYSYIPHFSPGQCPPTYLPPAPATMASRIAPEGVRLHMTTNSLRNVVLASQSDSIYYECSTPSGSTITSLTRVKLRVGEEPRYTQVAQFDERPQEPLRIRLRDERTWWPAAALLKFDPGRMLGEFVGDDGRTYRWTVHPKSRRLQLRPADAPAQAPLAEFHAPRKLLAFSRNAPYLELHPGVEAILDSLILSFLLMERYRRDLKL